MATVVVYTESGERIWSMEGVESQNLRALTCPMNAAGSALASGVRRAVEDAEAVQAGRNPERPSERAMRLAFGGKS
jgi:hypothetical protein